MKSRNLCKSSFIFVLFVFFCLSINLLAAEVNTPSSGIFSQNTIEINYQNDLGEDVWKKFRETFPYHVQTVAFHKESRTLIISEPPPHVNLTGLQEVIKQYSLNISLTAGNIKTHAVGVDGWVKDIVFQLPPMGESQTRDTTDSIQQYLFHTSYKAYVTQLPAAKPALYSDNLDLNVSVAEIKSWLFDKGEKLSALYGGDEQTADQLLTNKKSGIYFTKERGLVVWSINRNKIISDNLIEARQFVLDSDIIIGAVSSKDQILLVGRERIVPVEVLPPLRTETIMLLASVGDDELEQSYERTNIFAGRFNKTQDWAPIYLSNALIDTEFGSLLNLTDQFLKSWSMNGFIKYANFDYPNPTTWGKKWCFNSPLYEEANASDLTFNWNTQGVGYTTELGNREFFGLNRSGSLPTSYLEGDEQKSNYTEYEEKGYQCFASFGDPNLARVVQYTALYQIFQKFATVKDATYVKQISQPKQDVLTEHTKKLLVSFFKKRDEISSSESSKDILKELGEDGLQILANYIAHSDSLTEDIRQNAEIFERLDSAREDSVRFQTILNTLSPEKAKKIRIIYTALSLEKLLTDPIFKPFILVNTDIEKIKQEYQAASKRNDDEWIRTSSIVVSQPLGKFAESLEGGHNVTAEITHFRSDAAVPLGKIRTLVTGNRITFEFNPNDFPKIQRLVRSAAVMTKGKEITPQLLDGVKQRLETGLIAPPPSVRQFNVALKNPPPPPPNIPRGFKTIEGDGGWQPRPMLKPEEIPSDATTFAKYGDVAALIEKKSVAEGFEYTITTPDGKVIKAFSTPGAIDSIVGLGRTAKENAKVAFHLKGFTEGEAQGFLYNADLRLKSNSSMGFIKQGVKEPTSFVTKAKDYNLNEVNVGNHSLRQITEGQYKGLHELTINFDVPQVNVARQPLKVRLQMLYKNVVSEPNIAGIKTAVKSFFSKPAISSDTKMNDLIIDLANELLQIQPDAKKIITVWEDDTAGITIVEIILPKNYEGNNGKNNKSE